MESILNLGNQCKSDNAFTKKARLLQSMYRVKIGEEEGSSFYSLGSSLKFYLTSFFS